MRPLSESEELKSGGCAFFHTRLFSFLISHHHHADSDAVILAMAPALQASPLI